MARRSLPRRPQGKVVTDPALLASLRPSAEAIAAIERMEAAALRPRPRILVGEADGRRT
jgi:hypothetical protein